MDYEPGAKFVPELTRVGSGNLQLSKPVKELGPYPWSYLDAALEVASGAMSLINQFKPDSVVIEEINRAKARFSQKLLDGLHYAVLTELRGKLPVYFLSSSEWRRGIGLMVSKEDKKKNAKLSKAKRVARASGAKLDKKLLGIAGKKSIKHAAVDWANTTFGLKLLKKQDDEADALGLIVAHCVGIRTEYQTGED